VYKNLSNKILTFKRRKYTDTINVFFSTLDEAAMRSVAVLLKGLPLQPDCVDQDITEAKSEMFLK